MCQESQVGSCQSQYETKEYGFSWIKDKHIDNHYYRWNKLRNISSCHYEEIEIR